MKNRRYLLIKTTAIASLVFALFPTAVYAADPDYSDTTYWTKYCTDTNNAQSDACTAFLSYASQQSSTLSKTLTDIESQRTTIAANIEEYETKIKDYQTQIDDLNVKIDDLTEQIADLNTQIETKQQQQEELKTKVNKQIVNSQSGMRLAKEVDILMGAKTFTDFLRIYAGLTDITNRSQKNLTDLITITTELQKDQEKLSKNQEDLKTTQDDALAKQYEAQVIQQEYEKQDDALEQQQTETLSLSNSLDSSQESIQAAIAEAKRKAEEARLEELRRQEEEANKNNNNNGGGSSGGGGSSSGGSSVDVDTSTIGGRIVNYARQFLGNPYVYGGTDPYNGIDCSAFTQYVYGQFGIWLPRTSFQQENCGTVVSYDQAQPGDLITWYGHCGIYAGNGYVVNAMDPSWGIYECPIWWITNGNMVIHRLW